MISRQCDPEQQVPSNEIVYVCNLCQDVFELVHSYRVRNTRLDDLATGTDLSNIEAGC